MIAKTLPCNFPLLCYIEPSLIVHFKSQSTFMKQASYSRFLFIFSFVFCAVLAKAQKKGTASSTYLLSPSLTTIAWGNYWSEAKPALRIQSGDYVRVHTLITSSPDRLDVAGVPASGVEKVL